MMKLQQTTYMIKSIKVGEVEVRRGQQLMKALKGHHVLQVQIRIPLGLINQHTEHFVVSQVYRIQNVSIVTKRDI